MFLKGDVTIIVQKWGSTPRHAGSTMGPAPIGNFLPESFLPRLIQGRKIKRGFCIFIARVKLLRVRWRLIEAGTTINWV